MRLAVPGDSISSRRNGASAVSWVGLLETLIRDGGVFDIEVRNYSIPGLTWKSAHFPTPGWLIGGKVSPLQAIKRDGADLILPCLGVNDRKNPDAVTDGQSFADDLNIPAYWVRQRMFDPEKPDESVVTAEDDAAMRRVYDAIGGQGFDLNLKFIFDCGYSYDKLHPTNTGCHWISTSVYMALQSFLPLTPITRNTAWLELMKNTNPEAFAQMLRVPE